MNRIISAILALFLSSAVAHAEVRDTREWQSDVSKKTAIAVTDTAKSAVDNTVNIAETSVKDTAYAPKTAIDAVKDTANTALNTTDRALKTLTGEDRER